MHIYIYMCVLDIYIYILDIYIYIRIYIYYNVYTVKNIQYIFPTFQEFQSPVPPGRLIESIWGGSWRSEFTFLTDFRDLLG